MKIEQLVCPGCGAPLSGDFSPNQQIECDSCGSVMLATDLEAAKTIICPECRTINPIDKRFCSSCGISLKIDCVLCHTENNIGTVYCTNCGAHLERARSKRLEIQEARRQRQLERNRMLQEKEERQKEERLQRLLEDLDEPERHDFALYQIKQMGTDAIDALNETLLHDDDPDARYGSARALGQICDEHDIKGLMKGRAARALIKALTDPEPAVRYWSADALGRCKGQTAVEPLAALLKDEHAGVREQARHALQKIGGEHVEKILAEADKSKGILGWIKGN
jgi:phage FluMu protein Com